MASSIHTIHRPVARSKRAALPTSYRDPSLTVEKSAHTLEPSVPEEDEEASPVEDLDGGDFEQDHTGLHSKRPLDTDKSEQEALALIMERRGRGKEAELNARTRAGSMATVRLKRRTRLADKLKDVFELPGIHEVITGVSTSKIGLIPSIDA